jgi:hypothetical protein
VRGLEPLLAARVEELLEHLLDDQERDEQPEGQP